MCSLRDTYLLPTYTSYTRLPYCACLKTHGRYTSRMMSRTEEKNYLPKPVIFFTYVEDDAAYWTITHDIKEFFRNYIPSLLCVFSTSIREENTLFIFVHTVFGAYAISYTLAHLHPVSLHCITTTSFEYKFLFQRIKRQSVCMCSYDARYGIRIITSYFVSYLSLIKTRNDT